MLIGHDWGESLWADWSPGYDPSDDVAQLRKYVTPNNIANVICPYRVSFNPQFADPGAQAEEAATVSAISCIWNSPS